MRRFEVVIRPRIKAAPLKLREVSARHVGRLVSVRVSLAFTAGSYPHRECPHRENM